MRKGLKTVLFIGLGIFVLGVIITVVAFALNSFRFPLHRVSDHKETVQTISLEFDESFSNIEIDVFSADVTILKASGGIARMEYTGDMDQIKYETAVENDTLIFRRLEVSDKMSWSNPSKIAENLFHLIDHGYEDDVKLDIYLPEKEYDKLDISTISGDITAEEKYYFSEINLATVSGEIDLANMEGTENVNLATTSGEIEVANMDCRSQMLVVSTSSNISFEAVKSDRLKMDTVSGKTKLIRSTFQSTELHTISGNINLEQVNAEYLNASTISGDVYGTIDPDINVHGKTVSGTCTAPSGTKGNWTIETTSGNIKLNSN